MLKISVVIPAYNSATFLADALASAWGQSRRPAEILVVDDGSTDSTRALAAASGATVLETGVNSGPATARNIGMRAAMGDLIAFLDADDLWEPDHLLVCAGLLEQHPDAAVAFSMVSHFGATNHLPPFVLPDGVPVAALETLWEQNPVIQSGPWCGERRCSRQEVIAMACATRRTTTCGCGSPITTRFVCSHQRLVRYRVHGAATFPELEPDVPLRLASATRLLAGLGPHS